MELWRMMALDEAARLSGFKLDMTKHWTIIRCHDRDLLAVIEAVKRSQLEYYIYRTNTHEGVIRTIQVIGSMVKA